MVVAKSDVVELEDVPRSSVARVMSHRGLRRTCGGLASGITELVREANHSRRPGQDRGQRDPRGQGPRTSRATLQRQDEGLRPSGSREKQTRRQFSGRQVAGTAPTILLCLRLHPATTHAAAVIAPPARLKSPVPKPLARRAGSAQRGPRRASPGTEPDQSPRGTARPIDSSDAIGRQMPADVSYNADWHSLASLACRIRWTS